jgi:hypothetical protein
MGDDRWIANMVDETEDETGIEFHTLLRALSLMHPTDQMIDIVRIRYVFEKAKRLHETSPVARIKAASMDSKHGARQRAAT